MIVINSHQLTLADVHRNLKYDRQYNHTFTQLLSLESLSDFEKRELSQIRDDFDRYLTEGLVTEGQVKLLAIAPLLRLAGFYRYPINLSLEEAIDEIEIEDEDLKIRGRIDLLAVNKTLQLSRTSFFWIIVIESKNGEIAPSAGLPQLLTYAYKALLFQEAVWGLTTNGFTFQFVYIKSGNTPIYQLMPFLTLMEPEPAMTVLQVLKAIREMAIP